MSNLSEIEAAVEALSAKEKQELLLFLAARLRKPGARPPEPRQFSPLEMAEWIAQDKADMQRFREAE
ncbi:MAG TPA: hypothetical protein VHQ47_01820 [Phycisphaerae bacterium]|jgi:hypothetical protein|nr:hypothetical protein [Phycisphaerae bacterium]